MHIDFLLGPAGSGKTFHCLAEIRAALAAAPEGLPLVFLAPKQATFQLEREILADLDLPGYTRLQILSFERLSEFVLNQFFSGPPRLLSEEGRVMVLRALLARHYSELTLFQASARLPGFARQLSQLLNELQQHQLSPDRLLRLAIENSPAPQLRDKLRDLALLLRTYLDWLGANELQDPSGLLELAAAAVKEAARDSQFRLGGLWLDGFAELTPQELDLLAAFIPSCERVRLAFCLEGEPEEGDEWHSMWATISRTFLRCKNRLEALPDVRCNIEVLKRDPAKSRFTGHALLAHLEQFWVRPKPFTHLPAEVSSSEFRVPSSGRGSHTLATHHTPSTTHDGPRTTDAPANSEIGTRSSELSPNSELGTRNSELTAFSCPNPEAEAVVAAREILQHVRSGGRFRDVAVLVRSLDSYERVLRRVFTRYNIRFFIDRREPISHHPLAELTRYALRVLVSNWEHDDWFGALKTGLVHRDEGAIDRLENFALARGWRGDVWLNPVKLPSEPDLERGLEKLRRELVPPFSQLAEALNGVERQPNGAELATAIRDLWEQLGVAETLRAWSEAAAAAKGDSGDSVVQAEIHLQTLREMDNWLDNLELAFEKTRLPLGDWISVIEAGLANLSAGVIPPALDEVLIGEVNRSRNPNLEMVLLLGLNETVFPAPPPPPVLLTEYDRETLGARGLTLGLTRRDQIGHERLLGYLACTRARRRVVLTYSHRDLKDKPLNPSPFIYHLQRLFPDLEPQPADGTRDWRESIHPNELVVPLLRNLVQSPESKVQSLRALEKLPAFESMLARWQQNARARSVRELSAGLAEKLYGSKLETSISAFEDYAACPFKFFVVRGLRAEERKEFEVDRRERGSFQHEVLMEFHRRLQSRNKLWRQLSPTEANQFLGKIGVEVQQSFRDGLFDSTPDRRFDARTLIEGLQKLIEVLVRWALQYGFDPQAVEISFGMEEGGLDPWRIALAGGQVLQLRGRIDRVDLLTSPNKEAYVVVIDYKAGGQELEQIKLVNGLDLQLLAYLGVLRDAVNAEVVFGASKLVPAGAFYVGLRSKGGSGKTRSDVLGDPEKARLASYQHRGRFRSDLLVEFDSRDGVNKGDQFKYALNNDGAFSKVGNEVLAEHEFLALVDQVEEFLRRYGQEIYEGNVSVEPYRHQQKTACDYCDYRSICRFDPWVEPYRVLRPEPKAE